MRGSSREQGRTRCAPVPEWSSPHPREPAGAAAARYALRDVAPQSGARGGGTSLRAGTAPRPAPYPAVITTL